MNGYVPREIEPVWIGRWRADALFRADVDATRPTYSVVLPAPSVNSRLHTGHLAWCLLQDSQVRYRRMLGHEVLWLPGFDHAAIATQQALEARLRDEGLTKEQIGRAEFDRRVRQWYDEGIQVLRSQLEQFGCALDFSRFRFTVDDHARRAMRHAFVQLWEKGLISRGLRVVNWCVACQASISDMEVQSQQGTRAAHVVRCAAVGGSSVDVVVPRPELLEACAAVAVHADADLIGSSLVLPVTGKAVPVVADPGMKPEQGARAVLPAHSAADWEIGHRHGLTTVVGLTPDGTIAADTGSPLAGLPAARGRELRLRELATAGHLLASQEVTAPIPHCDSCGGELEELARPQWFLEMGKFVERARTADVNWHPERYAAVYDEWLSGMRDWCLSRQLWHGEPIPVYTCSQDHVSAAVEPPTRCATCGDDTLRPETDVLDTWFSAAIWPFVALGWPDDTPEFRQFYPTDLTVGGRSIIGIGLSRMIILGLEFTGEVPFRDILVPGTVHSPAGRQVTSHKGHKLDADEIIDELGADALRAWLAEVTLAGDRARFNRGKISGYHRLLSRLWKVAEQLSPEAAAGAGDEPPAGLVDRWLLARLTTLVDQVTTGLEQMRPHDAIRACQAFVTGDLFDRYCVLAEPRLRQADPAAHQTLLRCLDVLIRLLHPFTPFITEQMWQRLPGDRGYLLRAQWPARGLYVHADAERDMALAEAYVGEVRRLRGAVGGDGGRLVVQGRLPQEAVQVISQLADVEVVEQDRPGEGIPVPGLDAWLQVQAAKPLGDAQWLVERRDRLTALLADPKFTGRAPAEVVAAQRAKLAETEAALAALTGSLHAASVG
ncbi:class I tRNA ligase family protein [Micromonospora sp. CPCC 205546]|uniref:class I tRNA ligase family protein n=1 Tax=Micromonospora sp. CPCC 205546 TaxID=3122397 RepID=UPI002FF423C3